MTTYSTAVLADSPLFYYRMEESNGALVNSGSAGGTITKNGSPTWVTGADGRGFTVGSGYFVINSANDWASDKAFAIEMWIKAGTQATGIRTLMQRGTTAPYMTINLLGNNQASPGKVEWAYYTGSGQRVMTTTARVDTGSWVHLVFASTGSTMTIYVNGSVDASASVGGGSGSITTNTYIGNNTAGTQPANLDMDEFAIYDGNVGSSVATHSGVTRVPVSPTVDVTPVAAPMTMSLAAVQPVVIRNKSVSAIPAVLDMAMVDPAVSVTSSATVNVSSMTMSVSAPDAIPTPNLTRINAVADRGNPGSGSTNPLTFSGATYNLFKFDTLQNQTAEQAWLVLTTTPFTGTLTRYMSRLVTDWTEAGNEVPGTTGIGNVFFTSGKNMLDVTSIVNGWRNGTFANYGLKLEYVAGSGGGSVQVYTREEADVEKRPYLLVKYADGNKTVVADPMNMSTTSPDVSVTKQTRIDAGPMTLSSEFRLPSVSAEVTPNVNLFPEPMVMSLTMPGGNFTKPVNVAVSPLELNQEMVAPSVTSFVNAKPTIAPMNISMALVPPLEAGNITQDRYFNRIIATTDADDYIGFGSTTGFRKFVGGTGVEQDAWTIVGSWNNGIFGPESRRAIHLPGSYVTNDSNKPALFEWTFETVLRTTDANGTLVSGTDFNNLGPGGYNLSVTLVNGKITVTRTSTTTVTGRNAINDGEWHHILITFGGGTGINSGLRVFIDGQLDIRRELFGISSNTTTWAGPDQFFGGFDVDVESFSFRRSMDLDEPAITQNYYAAVGIYPIAVPPMTMSLSAPNAKGRGNQKRALMLYFVWRRDRDIYGNFTVPRAQELSFDSFPGDFEFGPNIPISAPSDFAGYKVFPVDANGGYRDEITDFPRLIDLQKDLNVDDYDLIFFRNWPNENTEIDALAANNVTREKLENLLKSIRWAVDQGKSFLITDPGLANDFGIIQSAAAVPVMYESDFVNYQGNASGDYDRRSYDVDPWRSPASAQFPADYYAHFYRDTHTNNRERVAATIAGLTDIPSYTLVDWVVRDNRDPFKLGGLRSLKYEYKNTLAIGDEFVNLSVPTFNPGDPDDRGQRSSYIWAVPQSGIKAGKAVTTLGNTIFTGGVEGANPYASWATTIAIEPGDTLNGTPVGGKIFVNIGEEIYNDGIPESAKIQIVPDNSNIPNPADWETPEQRAWQYSANRWNIGYTSVGGGSGGSSNTEGSVDAGAGKTGSWSPDLAGVDVSEKYPTQNISIHTMMSRGLVWLGTSEEREPGDAVVRVAAMSMTVEMEQPATTAQKPAFINVPAMVMNVQMVNPLEADDGNVEVRVLPMEMTLRITGYNKRIQVSPMEMSIEMVDNFNLVFAGGEQVVLVLHNVDATLTIEEGT